MHRRRLLATLGLFLGAFHLAAPAGPDSWPQFRGPQGDGIARDARPPVRWTQQDGPRWQTPIPGKGWASPVVLDDVIWIATASEDGRQLSILSVHADTGRVLLEKKLFDVAEPQFCHKFNSYASPTPVLDGNRVYVTYGSPGTACLDATTGEVLWERRDLECNHYRGAGSSPILWENLLIMNFDGSDLQYVVALDRDTGATVWKTDRSVDFKDLDDEGKPAMEGDYRKAFSTPHVAVIDEVPTLISQGAKALYAYDPRTGEELWRVEEHQNHSASTRPLYGLGLIFAPTGFSNGQLLAIRPGRKGEVLDANAPIPEDQTALALAWRSRRGTPKKPSLILHEGLLYGIEDGGVATCWDARTGEVLWNERIGGNHSASPLLANGHIYFFNEEGRTTVIKAGREFEKVAENTLGDGFMASPAVLGDSLILRSRSHLYRIDPPAAHAAASRR